MDRRTNQPRTFLVRSRTFLVLFALCVICLSLISSAQISLPQTTLTNAVDQFSSTIVVGSTSNAAVGRIVVIDQEAMLITAFTSTTKTINIQRGYSGTRADSHNAASVVWLGPASFFLQRDPSGTCTAAQVVVPSISLPTGTQWNCTAGLWTNASGGGGTPGGSSGQVQYNNAGVFGGIPGTTATSGAGFTNIGPAQQAQFTKVSTVGIGVSGASDMPRTLSMKAVDGFPRFTFIDGNVNNNNLYFVQCSDADCATSPTITLIANNGAQTASTPVLDMTAADGFARIAYMTGAHLHFIQCTNASCSTKTDTDVFTGTALAYGDALTMAAADGFARMTFDAGTNGFEFIQCTNASCSTNVQTQLVNEATDQTSAIAIAPDGFARISYPRGGGTPYKEIHFIQCPNAACTGSTNTTVFTDATPTIYWQDMVLGSDGFGRISWASKENVSFAKCTNAACSAQTITNITEVPESEGGTYSVTGTSNPTALALGADGFPRIFAAGNPYINMPAYFIRCTAADCSTRNVGRYAGQNRYPGAISMDAADGFPRLTDANAALSQIEFVRFLGADYATTQIGTPIQGSPANEYPDAIGSVVNPVPDIYAYRIQFRNASGLANPDFIVGYDNRVGAGQFKVCGSSSLGAGQTGTNTIQVGGSSQASCVNVPLAIDRDASDGNIRLLNGTIRFFAGATAWNSSGVATQYNAFQATVGNGLPALRYQTAQTTGNTSIGATTIFTAPAASTWYRISFSVLQVAAGTSCAGNSTIATNVIWTDPAAGGSSTQQVAFWSITNNGTANLPAPLGVSANIVSPTSFVFQQKASTVVQISTTYTAGGSCAPAPTVAVTPILESL